METEQFKFIYDDYKHQIKEIPPLQHLLRLTEKSTRKLDCINLYSITDKRDFDLQLEEQQIIEDIADLHRSISEAKQGASEEMLEEIARKFEKVKEKNIETFDILNRQDELLTEEIEVAEYFLEEEHHHDEIREEEEYEDEAIKENKLNDQNETTSKVNSLKKEIDDILGKIAKLNNGRGRWFQSDHLDFIKIYNRCGGNDRKIIEEGVKLLGMKNTEIMDHLEIYESYLQLQKEKKLISEEYKQIKAYEKLDEQQKQLQNQRNKQKAKKARQDKLAQENERKKEQVQKFREKKQEQKRKMLEEKEKEEKIKTVRVPLPATKRKEILERNKKFIETKQNNFKREQERKESIKRPTSSKKAISQTKLSKKQTDVVKKQA